MFLHYGMTNNKKYISYSWNRLCPYVCHLQCFGIYCNFLVVYKISKTAKLTQGGVKVVFLKNLFWKNTFSKYHLLFIHENITQQHLFFEDFVKVSLWQELNCNKAKYSILYMTRALHWHLKKASKLDKICKYVNLFLFIL